MNKHTAAEAGTAPAHPQLLSIQQVVPINGAISSADDPDAG